MITPNPLFSFDESVCCLFRTKQESQAQSDLLERQDFEEVFVGHLIPVHRLMGLLIEPFLCRRERLFEGTIRSLSKLLVIANDERVISSCVENGCPLRLEQIRPSIKPSIVLMEVRITLWLILLIHLLFLRLLLVELYLVEGR